MLLKFDFSAESLSDLNNTLAAEREQLTAGDAEHSWKMFPEELEWDVQ